MDNMILFFNNILHFFKVMILVHSYLSLERKSYKLQKLFIFFLILFATCLNNISTDPLFRIIWYELYIWLLFLILSRETKVTLLLKSIWSTLYLAVIDEMSAMIVNIIYFTKGRQLDLFSEILINVLSMTVTYLIACGLKITHSSLKDLKKRHWLLLIFVSCVYMFVILVQGISLLDRKPVDLLFNTLFVIEVLSIFFQMFLIFVLICSRKLYQEKEQLAKQYLNAQVENYAYLEQCEHLTKRFRHDIRNHIYVLRTLFEQKNYVQAAEYLDKLESGVENLGKGYSVNNGIVEAIINKYGQICERTGVPLSVSGHFPAECQVEAFDLCTIVSNLVSNAYEATILCSNPQIDVQIFHDDSDIILIFTNTYDGKLIIQEDQMITRKDKEYHGLGLVNVRDALKRNRGYMTFEDNNNTFKATVVLNNKKMEAL